MRLIDADLLPLDKIDDANYGSNYIHIAPTVDAIPIPKGATNGDMIKALFPNIEVETYGVATSVKGLDCDKGALDPYRHFWSDWWNAPYKEGE